MIWQTWAWKVVKNTWATEWFLFCEKSWFHSQISKLKFEIETINCLEIMILRLKSKPLSRVIIDGTLLVCRRGIGKMSQCIHKTWRSKVTFYLTKKSPIWWWSFVVNCGHAWFANGSEIFFLFQETWWWCLDIFPKGG